MNRHNRRTPSEMIDCRDCGATFNLAAQFYYTNLCPDCVEDERSKPVCPRCDERIDDDEGTYTQTRTLHGSETIFVHEDCEDDGREVRYE